MTKPAVRLGDRINCPRKGHGTNPIQSGSPDVFFDGMPAARVGDKTACGDTIAEGISDVLINGMPAAFLGCATAHGGIIVSGSSDIFIGTAEVAITTIQVEQIEHDQFLIFEDQDGQLLDNIPYRLTDPRGSVIDGATGSDGKTEIIEGTESQMLDCDIARREEA